MTGEAKPGLEAAKWLGFALMLADHVNTFFLDRKFVLVYLLGRLVFPLFALALADGLARGGEYRARGVARRLVLWGFIAQVPWAWVAADQGAMLNVLFSLLCGLVAYLAVFGTGRVWVRVLVGIAAVSASVLCEYGIAGCVLVFGACWFRESDSWSSRAALLAGLLLLYPFNGTWFALAALPVFLLLRYVGELPRARHWFYGLYAGHFVVIAFLRAAL